MNEPDHVLLRTFLAERDAPCPSCGYNLRGLTAARCPECNQVLVLKVGLAEPRLGAWIAGIVGLAAGAGFSGLLLVSLLVLLLREGTGSFLPEFVLVTGGGLIVEGLALSWWVRFGPRIRRLELPARAGLAAGCWFLSGINLAVFTMLML